MSSDQRRAKSKTAGESLARGELLAGGLGSTVRLERAAGSGAGPPDRGLLRDTEVTSSRVLRGSPGAAPATNFKRSPLDGTLDRGMGKLVSRSGDPKEPAVRFRLTSPREVRDAELKSKVLF